MPLPTLYEAVPVSEMPDRDEFPYDNHSVHVFVLSGIKDTNISYYDFDNEDWFDRRGFVIRPTHYLRPLPPERMEEWVREIVGKAWAAAVEWENDDTGVTAPDLQTFTDNLINEMSK